MLTLTIINECLTLSLNLTLTLTPKSQSCVRPHKSYEYNNIPIFGPHDDV